MLKAAYQFLLLLIVLAVTGGPAGQFMQPLQAAPIASAVDVPCDMAMLMADAGRGAPTMPCKGLTAECIKQMGCVTSVAMPPRLASTDVVPVIGPVAYWSIRSEMTGVAREPEPLPPRTA